MSNIHDHPSSSGPGQTHACGTGHDNVVPFARARRNGPLPRPRPGGAALAADGDGLVGGPLALALGEMLGRPRPDGRVCALAVMHLPECRLLEESFGPQVSRELDGLVQRRVGNALRKVGFPE